MSWTEIEQARNFVQAAISMGKVHMDRAIANGVDQTGHSCYEEGWAAGYQQAMQLVADFIAEKPEEAKPDASKYDEAVKYIHENKVAIPANPFGVWYAKSDWTDVRSALSDYRRRFVKEQA